MTEHDNQTDAEPILTVDGVSVSYDKVSALRDVSIRIPTGETCSVIGPNGAGKTTLSDTIAGYQGYSGDLQYRGNQVAEHSSEALVNRGLIYCSETRNLFRHMTVEENLRLGAYRRGKTPEDQLDFVYDLFPRLAERLDQEVDTMSGGEQQMLAVGRALMGEPELLILDEPTIGLAPAVVDDIDDGIERIKGDAVTLLICEQNVTFAMEHADYVYLLENGKVRREGPVEQFEDDEYIREKYIGG